MEHKSKTMLETIRGVVLDFVISCVTVCYCLLLLFGTVCYYLFVTVTVSYCLLLCYCLIKDLSHVTSTQGKTQDTLYIIWYLLNINNVCDLLRIVWRTKKWVIHAMPLLNLSSYTVPLSLISREYVLWG